MLAKIPGVYETQMVLPIELTGIWVEEVVYSAVYTNDSPTSMISGICSVPRFRFSLAKHYSSENDQQSALGTPFRGSLWPSFRGCLLASSVEMSETKK